MIEIYSAVKAFAIRLLMRAKWFAMCMLNSDVYDCLVIIGFFVFLAAGVAAITACLTSGVVKWVVRQG